jgi:hypothetical protein
MAALDISPNLAKSPIVATVVVTPSDSADLSFVTRALWVGGAGTITLIDLSGNTTLFSGILAGTWLWIRATRIKATGTSATLIVGMA